MQFLYDHLVAFALALFAAIACALAALLLKKRITRLAIELRHRIRPVSLAVFLSFATLATIFAQKPATNDVDGASNPLALSPPRLALPGASDSVLTNGLRITGFSLLTNGVEIASAWPDGVSMLSLNLLYSRYLLSNDWVCIDSWAPLASATNDVRTVAFGGAFTNAPSGFFKLTGLDADGDDDGDGIPNSVEIEVGLDPASADTDGDGAPDGDEYIGLDTSAGASVPWIPDADMTVYAYSIPTTYSGAGLYASDLPFQTTLAGLPVDRVAVDLKGVVYFGSATNLVGLTSRGSIDLSTDTGLDCVTVAPYWKDLGITSLSLASVRFATATLGAERVFVLLVTCMGTSSPGGMCNLRYQITVGEGTPGVVNVKYWSNQETVMSRYAAIGAQGPRGGDGRNFPKLSHFYGPRLPVMNGTTFTYRLGCGSDPKCYDTDGDGMPDGWELACGLNPNDATGANGAAGDADGDGRTNIEEYCLDLDPQVADSEPQVPEGERKTLTFNIYGDYAAWEMTIAGLGPVDSGIRRVTMGAPDSPQNAQVTLRKGNAYRLSMRWLNCDGHNDSQAPWYCWQALIDGLPSQCSFNHSYIEGYCVRIPQRNNIVVGNGWIAENEGGLLTSHVHSSQKNSDGGSGAGNVAGGLVATLYVLDDPKLMPDFDRNGKIDANDETLADLGRVFRFWINDDEDDDATDGKYAESPSVDIPGARTGVWEFDGRDPDWDDDEVNGWRDLIDFTPIYMDVSCIHGLPKKIRDNLTFKLRHDSEAVNVVWTDLAKTSVGMFQKGTVAVCGRELDENSYEAETETVDAEGLEIPDALLRKMCSGTSDKGVMFVEGRKATSSPLKLDVYYGDQKVATGELDMELSSVEDMYWFYSLHGAEDVDYFNLPGHYTPGNLMDGPKDRDVFFTHGFNVSAEDARAWGSEVFKRLWQSGSDARFHMVAWPGNYNWTGNWANGLHYQRDVYQALKCANAFKRLVEREQGDSSKRVVMAQSLGNMMACEAFRQGLAANQYFMFDAAVASEAIDAAYHNNSDATRSRYVPSDWIPYDSMSWAANWYRWFKDDPSDSRGKMGWPDYFKTALTHVGSVCNYYSTGDPVFMEDTSVPSVLTGVFHWPTLHWTWPFIDLNITAEANCWQKQETHKGVEPIAGNLKGGWGFYWWMESSGDDEYPVFYSAATTSVMVANGSITNNPVFYYLGTQMDNRNASQDDIWFALAEYVPAVSSPVGGNRIWSEAGKDVNLNDNSSQGVPRPNGWGRAHNVFGASWFHSDMKDMAFFYVYKLYEQLVTKGSLQ